MTCIKNKLVTILIATLLMISISTPMIMFPTTNAHTPAWQLPTYMYVHAAPNPIGVGQTTYVNIWVSCPPPTANVQYGDVWHNLTATITYPDGTIKTIGPLTSDSSGGAVTTFTPTIAGNYTFQSFFGGQTLAGDNPPPGGYTAAVKAFIGDYYQPSQSSPFTLNVQQDPIPGYMVNPLPTNYWERPIYAENNEWASISGNWMGAGPYNATGCYNPYTTAPTTAHILWTKPEAFGGMIGGEFGDSETSNYYSTRQYETMFLPVIMNGILYYTAYPGSTNSPAGTVAVDLHTGKTLWTSDSPRTAPNSLNTANTPTQGPPTVLKCGQILNFISPNQYGGLAYLWTTGTPAMVASATNIASGTTTYNLFDAMTGNYILSVVNGTGFSAVTEDTSGDLICYYLNSSTANVYKAPTLNMWNSTQAIMNYNFRTNQNTNPWQWRPPQGAIVPFSDGIAWSAPLEYNISGNPITLAYTGIDTGVIFLTQYGSISTAFQSGWIVEAGYSSVNGRLLWGPVNRTEAPNTRIVIGQGQAGSSGFGVGSGAWVECNLNTLTASGYDLLTGAQLWGPEAFPNVNPLSSLGMQQVVANGTIYIWTYGGDVYAINVKTGNFNWQYHSRNGGIDSPYGVEPLWTRNGAGVVAGGMLFVGEGHEFAPPLYHGAKQMAWNITNGQIVWNITAFDVNGYKAVSDGVLTMLNAYDNQIYGYGMGPSKTTIASPDVGVSISTPMTITGSVTDVSAGSQQDVVAANYPNGLPCVSDASMSQFMETVYMQQPMPTNISGVPVVLSVIDSNGNYRQIGSTTTNAMGTFGLTWTPDIPGDYTIIATFEGSGSYYGSSAQTYFHASDVSSTPTPTNQPVNLERTQNYIMGVGIAIIIVVIAGFALLALMLRKRQ